MAIQVVRLGSARVSDEGLRLGTVRRPPRGIPRDRFARDNFYDVWLPTLAPSASLVKAGLAAENPAEWRRFRNRYLAEMSRPDPRHVLDLLAALSHRTNFSVGCYCEDEARCHRSLLRELLAERGAALV